MRKVAFGIVAGLAAGLIAVQAASAAVIDQQQLLANAAIPLPDDAPAGQSFTAGLTGTLAEIDVYGNAPSSGDPTATLTIYSGAGLSGTVQGSETVNMSTPGESLPISFDVSSLDIPVTTGDVYSFGLSNFADGSVQITDDESNPYAGGQEYDNPTYYGNNPGWDLTFQTLVESSAVPEPASLSMLGLCGMALVYRRRRHV